MILDTTYLLPLAKIDVDTDLLKAITERKVDVGLSEIIINLISVFELQAKAASLSLPFELVAESVEAIFTTFRVEPFHTDRTLQLSFELRRLIPDYIDCIILATAAALKEDLVTEDSRIVRRRKMLQEKCRIKIFRYQELLRISKRM